jgi:putative protein kinase ArgK-like GTPase of G3E family
VSELAATIEKHASYLRSSGEWSRRESARLSFELEAMVSESLSAQFHARVGEQRYARAVSDLVERRRSPGEVLQTLLNGKSATRK